MARLVYSMLTSVDGYVADEAGDFSWAEPDEEVHRFVNDLARPVRTYLYGRRMYEVMAVWDDPAALAAGPAYVREFGGSWRAADKVVYSATLAEAPTRKTRLERTFDPDEVRRLKEAAEHDLAVGGPHLAAHALRAGLVDELLLFTVPVVVGGGTPWLPERLRLRLETLEERRFSSGIVYLRYRIAGSPDGGAAGVRRPAA